MATEHVNGLQAPAVQAKVDELRKAPGLMPRFPLRTFFLLGSRIDNLDGDTARKIIRHYIVHQHRARKVFFTNVHTIYLSLFDPLLRLSVNAADLVLADGSGLKIGGKLMGHPIRENLNGTDFTPTVLRDAEREGWSVYLLGATDESVALCAANLRRTFPSLRISGWHDGYFRPEEEQAIVADINAAHPDILLVALGTPAQESWCIRNGHRLNVKVCMAVGGLFDFLSLRRRRAPGWLRGLGLEWVYRFLVEPKAKWNRVLIEIPVYLGLLAVRTLLPKPLRRFLRGGARR